jgi:biopolymer transport protein TolR
MSHFSADEDLKSEINVIPLIDVMLVLLIIFMITAPLLNTNMPVKLPKARGVQQQGSGQQITLTITKDGQIFLGSNNLVSLDELGQRAKSILDTKGAEQKIFIRADENVNYGLVLKVMGELVANGITNINLVANQATSPSRKN